MGEFFNFLEIHFHCWWYCILLMPVATKDFRFEAAGDIVFYTLQHAFIMDMYSYSFYFQVVMILALIAVVVWKGKFSRVFTAITGCFYLLYAVIQNMAVTEQHGFSMVTVNVVMIGFVALVWLCAAWKGNNEFSFDNVTWKTGWTIPVALFCLWWPMSLKRHCRIFSCIICMMAVLYWLSADDSCVSNFACTK